MLIEDKETPKEMRKLLKNAKSTPIGNKDWRQIADEIHAKNGSNKDKPILLGQAYVSEIFKEKDIKINARPTQVADNHKFYRTNIDKQIQALEFQGYDKHNMINVFTIITKITYHAWSAALAHGLLLTPYVEQPEQFLGFNSTEWFEAEHVISMFQMYYRMFDATDSVLSMNEALTCIVNHAYRTSYRYGVDLDLLLKEYCRYILENVSYEKEFALKYDHSNTQTQSNEIIFIDANLSAEATNEKDTIEIDQIVQALKEAPPEANPSAELTQAKLIKKQPLTKPENILDIESVLSTMFLNSKGLGVNIVHNDNVFTTVYSNFTLREPWRNKV